mmetsp:Transcript_98537/g.205495  ORF Transcript_98537/g.205495 Transcript_98537/m.205495 type:complete len:287 (-) Transcript_98537:52-912(-)
MSQVSRQGELLWVLIDIPSQSIQPLVGQRLEVTFWWGYRYERGPFATLPDAHDDEASLFLQNLWVHVPSWHPVDPAQLFSYRKQDFGRQRGALKNHVHRGCGRNGPCFDHHPPQRDGTCWLDCNSSEKNMTWFWPVPLSNHSDKHLLSKSVRPLAAHHQIYEGSEPLCKLQGADDITGAKALQTNELVKHRRKRRVLDRPLPQKTCRHFDWNRHSHPEIELQHPWRPVSSVESDDIADILIFYQLPTVRIRIMLLHEFQHSSQVVVELHRGDHHGRASRDFGCGYD